MNGMLAEILCSKRYDTLFHISGGAQVLSLKSNIKGDKEFIKRAYVYQIHVRKLEFLYESLKIHISEKFVHPFENAVGYGFRERMVSLKGKEIYRLSVKIHNNV